MRFVVLNAGSSSIKFSLFRERDANLRSMCAARSKASTPSPRFVAKDAARHRRVAERRWGEGIELGHDGALDTSGRVPARALADCQLVGVGHRVVHGGHDSRSPCASTPSVMAELEKLVAARAAAPAAQPRADPASAARRPELPQVACFDTAFHRTIRESRSCSRCPGLHEARRAALWLPRPVLRVHRLACWRSSTPKPPRGRTVVLHLGNGASMCAMRGRPQRRQHHGLHRGRRPADGHALRLARSRRDSVPHGPARHGRARDREADLQRSPGCSACRASPATCARSGVRAIRARVSRSICIAIASGASSARSPRRWAGSTRSCSPPASARTRPRSATASAATRLARRRARRGGQPGGRAAHQHPGGPGLGVGHPDQRGSHDRATCAARGGRAAAWHVTGWIGDGMDSGTSEQRRHHVDEQDLHDGHTRKDHRVADVRPVGGVSLF